MDEDLKDWKLNKTWFCPSGTKPIIDETGHQVATFNIYNSWGIFHDTGRNGICGSYGINGYCLIPASSNTTAYEGGVPVQHGWKTPDEPGSSNAPWWTEALRFDLWPLETMRQPQTSTRLGWATTWPAAASTAIKGPSARPSWTGRPVGWA